MAALHHGATAAAAKSTLHHRRSTPENISLVKPAFFVSSSSISFPAKHARRRNHLRQKILKTLKNPIIPKLPPTDPIIPTISPPQEIKEVDVNQEIQEFEKSDISELAENEEPQELKVVEVSAPAGAGIDEGIGVAGKDSILKYGWWFVGAFVFQTVFAVLFVGLDDIDNKREIVNGSGKIRAKDTVLDDNGNVKMGLANGVTGGGNVNVENLEMENEIEEIRIMAREVREKERLQSKRNGGDGEEDEGTNGGKVFKSGIEEEVDGTLVKLRKKLGKTRLETPLVGNLSGETKRGDEVEKSGLSYKKKYKFKDFSGDTVEKPKGFVDSRVDGDLEEGNELVRSGNGDDNGERRTKLSNDDLTRIDTVRVVEETNKKGMPETIESTRNTRSKATKTSRQGKRKGVAKPKVIDGSALRNSYVI